MMGSENHWEQREEEDESVMGLMRLETMLAVDAVGDDREDLCISRNLSMPSDVRPQVAEGGMSHGGGMGAGATLRSGAAAKSVTVFHWLKRRLPTDCFSFRDLIYVWVLGRAMGGNELGTAVAQDRGAV